MTHKAAMTSTYKSLYGHVLTFLLGEYLGVDWLGYVCFTFLETAKLFSEMTVPFYIPCSSMESSGSSTRVLRLQF